MTRSSLELGGIGCSMASLSRRDLAARLGSAFVMAAAGGLAACSGLEVPEQQPQVRTHGAKPYRPADPNRFVAIVNAYRAKFGLHPLGVDGRLTAIATTYARHLADANQMTHSLAPYGPLQKRLGDNGYAYLSAGENLGEGYRDMDEVFEGWRLSPGHEREMRDPDATVMGLGSAWREDSSFKAYWCLILAKPRPPGMPIGEPMIAVRRSQPTSTFTFGGAPWPF